jgi:hypothetical protein
LACTLTLTAFFRLFLKLYQIFVIIGHEKPVLNDVVLFELRRTLGIDLETHGDNHLQGVMVNPRGKPVCRHRLKLLEIF